MFSAKVASEAGAQARTRAAGLFIVLYWCLQQRDLSSADHPAFPSHPAPKALAWGCPAVEKGASRGSCGSTTVGRGFPAWESAPDSKA